MRSLPRCSAIGVIVAAIIAGAQESASRAEPHRVALISAEKNRRVDELELSGKKLTPKSPAWTICKITLHGGKQEGVDVIVVNNGKLEFTVVPTRGMGLLSAT